MSHSQYKQRADSKREIPQEFNEELLDLLNELVKDKAEQRELNQEASNGRDKGN